jgi:hypothetical protein
VRIGRRPPVRVFGAAADGVKMSQLKVLTLISDGPTPREPLHNGRGFEQVRRVGSADFT